MSKYYSEVVDSTIDGLKSSSYEMCRMRLFFVSIFLLLSIKPLSAEDIHVSFGLPKGEVVELILFDSANSFGDNRNAVRSVRYELDGREKYSIENIAPGQYALLIYHDENKNGLMDRNFIGIPKEPVAYANGYRPKGPPSFKKASFVLEEGVSLNFDVSLEKPLGEFGRVGVGVGVITRSSPYRDYSGDVYTIIPAVTYMGERPQIYGPDIKLGLFGSDKLRVAAAGHYRMSVYNEEDSPYLAGMGNPESTFLAGLALVSELPAGIDISVGYSHDVLDKIGGGDLRMEVEKSFQAGILRISPRLSANRISSDLANNDFGISADKANPQRPAYNLSSVTSFEVNVNVLCEFKRGWLVIVNGGVEFLEDQVVDSPIVSDDYVVKGLGIITYVF